MRNGYRQLLIFCSYRFAWKSRQVKKVGSRTNLRWETFLQTSHFSTDNLKSESTRSQTIIVLSVSQLGGKKYRRNIKPRKSVILQNLRTIFDVNTFCFVKCMNIYSRLWALSPSFVFIFNDAKIFSLSSTMKKQAEK